MKIERILAGIRESQTSEKTASETPVAPATDKTATTNTALVAALNDALSSKEKIASETPATSPINDVMKVAEELAGAEKEAAVKEAQILGTAFADAAVARMAEWNKQASQMVSSSPVVQEDPERIKQAAQMGYAQAKADLEKQAEESYVQGYNDTVETIHKTASLEFLKAAAVTAQIIQASTK